MHKRSGPNKAWRATWVQQGGATPGPCAGPSPSGSQSPSWHRPSLASVANHPFAEPAIAADLNRRADEIESGYTQLAQTLKALAPHQFTPGFAQRAVAELARIGVAAEAAWFEADWLHPVDMGVIQARCRLRLFARLVQTGGERHRYTSDDGEPVAELIQRWGFHAVDITPCADGRLAGLLGAVLRIPLSIVAARRSYAGSLFPVSQSIHDWGTVELRRWRTRQPNAPDAGTRYLKIGVYHYSSLDPHHEGCAAHGSDDAAALTALHDRLVQFQGAVQSRYGVGQDVALLLVGLDTDTDAIRVHVPDASGAMQAHRFVDAADLHGTTAHLRRDAAKDAVREAVAACAGVDPADPQTEGMRWFCGYLLKNNISQVEAVLQRHGGPYPVAGHDEKLILIGDPADDVQLRNLAFQAQMDSAEEGEGDLAVGIRILRNAGIPVVPILALKVYDPDMPGGRATAEAGVRRMTQAVKARFADQGILVEPALRAGAGGPLEFLDTAHGRASP